MIRRVIAAVCLMCLSALSLADNAGEYKLGPGDAVKITVYDHADLSLETVLTREGQVSFPLIGLVPLSGKSANEAEALIAKRLEEGLFVKNPQVSVLVSGYRSQRVSVIGEVNRPGRINLDSPTSLVDILAMASGVAASGGDNVVLIKNGQRTVYSIAAQMMADAAGKQAVMVGNGDVVYVPRSQVFVMGEVNRPGTIRLEAGMTVQQALAAAGGFTQRASHSSIVLSRRNAEGKLVDRDAELGDTVEADDVVTVKESWF